MSDIAVRVEGLGKQFSLGQIHHDLLAEKVTAGARWVTGALSRLLRPGIDRDGETGEPSGARSSARGVPDLIWAIKDVSFDVKRGEVMGIIGANGAGKSTLLKILTGISEPTEGEARLYGRIGSLLEVGTGFHPELTGRENVYMNGAVLGMGQAEIRHKFDEIVDFSGVERFIDTPVKRYSSGMLVRLGFAVAAHLEPEILLVDEVLAVGDYQFQHRCLGKMREVAGGGRTVLFVSHNMAMIQELCPETVLLENGRLRTQGPSRDVVRTYLQDAVTQEGGECTWNWDEKTRENAGVFLPLSLRVVDQKGDVSDRLSSCSPFHVELKYELTEQVSNMRVGITLRTADDQWVCISYDRDDPEKHGLYSQEAGGYVARCTIPAHLLNDITYVVGLMANIRGQARLYHDLGLVEFSVDVTGGVGSHWARPRSGVVRPPFDWKTERVE